MTSFAFGLLGITTIFVMYTLIAPSLLNLHRFVGAIAVTCPAYKAPAVVQIGAWSSALRAAYGMARPQVRRCNVLRQDETCDQECLCDRDW